MENRLKAVHDAHELLAAMAYDGDGNRIFQLNYNLHTDDDWKNNSGNGNGSNKDNTGSSKTVSLSALGLDDTPLAGVLSGLGCEAVEEDSLLTAEEITAPELSLLTAEEAEALAASPAEAKRNENGNNGNNGDGGNGDTNNTGGSQNQSGILMPQKPVSEIEQSLIDEIRQTGHYKNYELIEYVNDVNRENTEVLMEANIDGAMDTAYTYGNERIALERFTGWTGYYTYDPRGSVSGVTDSEGKLWKSYRYSPTGDLTFGKPQYNNSYSYNAEDYNPNLEVQYLRARYYDVERGNFLTEDPYLGKLTDPLSLNRYNYVKSSAPNYVDPSGYEAQPTEGLYVLDSQGNIKNSYYETAMSPYKQASELQAGSLQERWSYFTEGIKGALNKAQENTLKKMIDRVMESARIEQCIDKLYIGSVSVMQSLSSLILGAVYGAFKATPFGALQSFIHELVGIEVGTHQDARDVLIGLGGNRTAFGLGEAIGKTVTTVLEAAALLILLFTGPGGAALSLATVGNATGAAIQAIVLDGTAIQITTGAGVGVSIALSGDSNAAKGQENKGNEGESDSEDYKAPEGGGGVTDNVKVGDKEVSFGHGGRHLEGTGLSANEVNQAIAKDVVTKNPGTGQFYKGKLNVNCITIEYTSYGVKNGLINVGTYYPVQ